MAHRFFHPDLPPSGPVRLEGEQAKHAIQVMRFGPGDVVHLFDGDGREVRCQIDSADKKSLDLTLLDTVQVDRELPHTLRLAVAMPKGDRQKFLVEKLVEVGVHELIPLATQRSVAVINAKAQDRLAKQVIEACKQCERNRLMHISPPLSWPQLLNRFANNADDIQTWVGDPDEGEEVGRVLYTSHAPKNNLVVIGPEGGLTPAELEAAVASGRIRPSSPDERQRRRLR